MYPKMSLRYAPKNACKSFNPQCIKHDPPWFNVSQDINVFERFDIELSSDFERHAGSSIESDLERHSAGHRDGEGGVQEHEAPGIFHLVLFGQLGDDLQQVDVGGSVFVVPVLVVPHRGAEHLDVEGSVWLLGVAEMFLELENEI